MSVSIVETLMKDLALSMFTMLFLKLCFIMTSHAGVQTLSQLRLNV